MDGARGDRRLRTRDQRPGRNGVLRRHVSLTETTAWRPSNGPSALRSVTRHLNVYASSPDEARQKIEAEFGERHSSRLADPKTSTQWVWNGAWNRAAASVTAATRPTNTAPMCR